MDIGDILFLIFIALGGLSGIFGGKKKQTPAAKGRPREPRAARPVPPPPPPATGRPQVANEMDRILAELGFAEEPEQPEPEFLEPPRRAAVEPARSPTPSRRMFPDVDDSADEAEPEPESAWEAGLRRSHSAAPVEVHAAPLAPVERVVPTVDLRHQNFHDRYVTPLRRSDADLKEARAARYLNRDSLRRSILIQEILMPPVSMR